jgi:hypothetical protein
MKKRVLLLIGEVGNSFFHQTLGLLHLRSRGMFMGMEKEEESEVPKIVSPMKLSRTPCRLSKEPDDSTCLTMLTLD